MWKSGDSVSLPIRLVDATDTAQTYVNAAAFTGAGWALTWYKDGTALSSQPTYTITNIGSGLHFITFTLSTGFDTIFVTRPAGYYSDPAYFAYCSDTYDWGSIASLLTTSVGSPINNSRSTTYDWQMIEGDAFQKDMIVPTAALSDFGYTDLSDIGGNAWTIAAKGRLPTNNPPSAADFTFTATIIDKPGRKVRLYLSPGTSPPSVDYTVGRSRVYNYDVQLTSPSGASPIAVITPIVGTLTVNAQVTP